MPLNELKTQKKHPLDFFLKVPSGKCNFLREPSEKSSCYRVSKFL